MAEFQEPREIVDFSVPESPANLNASPDQEFSLKLLIANTSAGSIIGKAGATVAQLQTETNAQIRLSQNRQYFPNTQDRVVLIKGTFDALRNAIGAVISRTSGQADGSISAQFAVPNSAAGLIIGHGGSTIRNFQDTSSARVHMSQKTGVGERILSISGTSEATGLAVALFLDKLLEDPSVFAYQNLSTSYSGGQQGMFAPYQPAEYPPNVYGYPPRGPYPNVYPPPRPGPVTTLTVNVPDAFVGAIVGKSGANIMRIQRNSGANVKVSQRGEYAPGTSERVVTISGPVSAANHAQKLVVQRLQEVVASASAANPAE